MKKKTLAIIVTLCLISATTAFAGGYHRGGYGGFHGHHGGGYDNGLGLAVGIAGGLILGSALLAPPPPPPVPVVHNYPVYQPEVIVQQPEICFEERVTTGEWQVSSYDGRQRWVYYSHPLRQRFEVPCY